MMRLKKILVPIDFSKEAELAIEWAVKLAKEEKEGTIILLHNLAPIIMLPESGYEVGRLIEDRLKQAKEDLEAWQEKIPPPLTSVAYCAQGELVEEVVNVCNKDDVDLVVMTTQGRHGISRVVHPNVTEKVVRTAPCPVLVLHLNPKMEALAKTGS